MKKEKLISTGIKVLVLMVLWSVFFMIEDRVIPAAGDYTAVELQLENTDAPVVMRKNHEKIVLILRFMLYAGSIIVLIPECIYLLKKITGRE